METDYREAGMPYDRPGVRIQRLGEALEIIRSMWTQERTSFTGKHYRITNIAQAAELPAGERPRILVGAAGRAARRWPAATPTSSGSIPTLIEGKVTPATPADLAPERVREKTGWVREAAARAGRDPDALEFNTLSFVLSVTDDPKPLREALAATRG